MPELPEVESVRQVLIQGSPSLLNRTVQKVTVLRSSALEGDLEFFQHQMTDAACTEICRHAKYLFFGFKKSGADRIVWMVVHLRMTGRLYLLPQSEPVHRHTRLILGLDQGVELRFEDPRAFGRVWLVDSPAVVINTLGPDALDVGRDQFMERLAGVRRQLKPLLLDQSFVSGIGNIYADELLFRAGLHPQRSSDSLNSHEKERLFSSMHGVLSQAVELKGANIDGVFEAGQFPVAVYGCQGAPCKGCGTLILKMRLGQRGTHFCPVCQPLL